MSFQIDPSNLFDEVTFDPRIPPNLVPRHTADIRALGYNNAVNQSALYRLSAITHVVAIYADASARLKAAGDGAYIINHGVAEVFRTLTGRLKLPPEAAAQLVRGVLLARFKEAALSREDYAASHLASPRSSDVRRGRSSPSDDSGGDTVLPDGAQTFPVNDVAGGGVEASRHAPIPDQIQPAPMQNRR